MPINLYPNWNKRNIGEELIEPYRKYYIICEGANTETFYFKKLIDLRKELHIHPNIEIKLCEKTEEDRSISYPKHLIDYANSLKKNKTFSFDKKRDKMIIVFDADIFEYRVSGYDELINDAEMDPTNILAITNPSFELFLLLHIPNSLNELIFPHKSEFLMEENLSKKSLAYTLLLSKTHMNSKRNPNIGYLANQIDIAIEQEKELNQDIHKCKGTLTSNIGSIIQSIRSEN